MYWRCYGNASDPERYPDPAKPDMSPCVSSWLKEIEKKFEALKKGNAMKEYSKIDSLMGELRTKVKEAGENSDMTSWDVFASIKLLKGELTLKINRCK